MKTIPRENITQNDGQHKRNVNFEFSFAFGYKQLHQKPLFVYADELFYGGMIKPLKVCQDSEPLLSNGKQIKSSKTSSQQKDSRSELSSIVFKSSPNFLADTQQDLTKTMDKSSLGLRSWSRSSDKKWKLKDLLLFRSVSEGHASTRDNHGIKCHESVRFSDQIKYSQVKNGGEMRRKKQQGISAHERHYTSKRMAGEEMKRKTFLPYKKTLLIGCSDLDPGVYEFCKGHVKC